jgi:hypothetical protein
MNSLLFSQDDKNYMYKDGIVFLAVDNLPTEFPREATTWFGDCLLPFMEPIVSILLFITAVEVASNRRPTGSINHESSL